MGDCRRIRPVFSLIVTWSAFVTAVTGCASNEKHPTAAAPLRVVVVAPVINLSGTSEFDPLQVTDALASEFLSFPNFRVIPVNLTLAALQQRGKRVVDTAEEARELAAQFGADATVVVAITEYRPFDPPVMGLVMQWYEAPHRQTEQRLDPTAASRSATEVRHASAEERVQASPRFQVQAVYDASRQDVQADIRDFADTRRGENSPYGWRRHLKSQELYVRYCCWAAIRTMVIQQGTDLVAQRSS